MYTTPAGNGLCVGRHTSDPERPRKATDGGHLCESCLHRLDRDLTDLPRMHGRLELALIPGGGRMGAKVSGDPERALPYNTAAAEARTAIADVLGSWTRLVAEERGFALPADMTVPGQAVWHRTQLPWLGAQLWVCEYTSNLHEAVRAGWRAMQGPRVRRTPVGLCPDLDRCDVATRTVLRCTGTLWALTDLLDDLLPAQVTCSGCGTAHSARDLPALGRRLTGGVAWLTTAQAAQVLGLSPDRARVRALTEGWRLRGDPGARPSRWHADDVDASATRREA